MENPIKMGWIGGTIIFGNSHINIFNFNKKSHTPNLSYLSWAAHGAGVQARRLAARKAIGFFKKQQVGPVVSRQVNFLKK